MQHADDEIIDYISNHPGMTLGKLHAALGGDYRELSKKIQALRVSGVLEARKEKGSYPGWYMRNTSPSPKDTAEDNHSAYLLVWYDGDFLCTRREITNDVSFIVLWHEDVIRMAQLLGLPIRIGKYVPVRIGLQLRQAALEGDVDCSVKE